MRIGIDVGGTNTDAVVMDGDTVAAWCKTTTTEEVGSGIATALAEVLADSGIDKGEVETVMIGTTHFTNAFVERKRLLPVGCAPRSAATATWSAAATSSTGGSTSRSTRARWRRPRER